MYRQYENPWELEEELARLEYELTMAEYEGASDDELADIQIEIAEIKDRINFAWQDNEFEMDNYDYADEEQITFWDTEMEWNEDMQLAYEDWEVSRCFGGMLP